MRHIILVIVALIMLGANNYSHARSRSVTITCSQTDAEIFANGQSVGKGNAKIIVMKDADMTVKVVMNGYLTETHKFYYRKGMPAEKSYHFDLKNDDAFDASTKTEMANVDIGINTSKPKDKAWEAMAHVILLYFDVAEQMDERAGYLRTAWVTQSFAQSTVRTRVILRTASLEPLSFRIKLVSEISDRTGVKGNDDERFKPWDRVLRKYEQLIPELQARLK